jgi:hypothetical protein
MQNEELDLAVDKCYRKHIFKNNKEHIEFLFELYEGYVESKNMSI